MFGVIDCACRIDPLARKVNTSANAINPLSRFFMKNLMDSEEAPKKSITFALV
jgi:hypothetical protein